MSRAHQTVNVKHFLRLIALAVIFVGCTVSGDTDPRVLSSSMHAIYGVIRVERLSPPVASRLTAYATTALYAGLASSDRRLPPLDGVLNGISILPRSKVPGATNATIVAVVAERVVLDSLLREALPTTTAALGRLADSLIREQVTNRISPGVQYRSDTLGRKIGLAIVAWSRTDGFDGTRGRSFAAKVGDSFWINDAPANTFATQNLSGVSEFVALDNPANQQRIGNLSDRGLILSRPKSSGVKTLPAVNISGASEPYWNEVRPFALAKWNECAMTEPPSYSRDTTQNLYHRAREVYDLSRSLTAEQRTIAFFWADNSGETGTPVGHWLSIASQMIGEQHLSANSAAQLLLATAVAQADAFIAAWGYKYQFNSIRPRTYIRRVIDSTWEPLIPTPPFPEYPSGHSTQSAAAATVITALLGALPFSDSTSISIGHAVRNFPSFQAASAEAGLSRVYAGLHFQSGNVSGLALGRCIGERVQQRIGGMRNK